MHSQLPHGMTENAGRETNGRNCRHENAGHENVRHARQTLLLQLSRFIIAILFTPCLYIKLSEPIYIYGKMCQNYSR